MSKSKTPTSFLCIRSDKGSRRIQISLRMQKVAICLSSGANHGKSTSLKKLGYLLIGELCTEREILKVFDYRGVQVGISSSGDYLDYFKPGFDHLIASECDIVVCACRSKGAAADYAYNTSKNMGYEVSWMGAAVDYGNSFQDICNNQIANAIKGIIDEIIDNQ